MQLTFGKYKGQSIGKVPEDYLIWASKNLDNIDIVRAIKAELSMRSNVESSMRSALKENPSDPKALIYYRAQFLKAENDKINASDCPWEYSPTCAADSVEENLNSLLNQLESEKNRENIIASYIKNNPELTEKMIKQIFDRYVNDDLHPEQFSTDDSYQLALEIGERLVSIDDWKTLTHW